MDMMYDEDMKKKVKGARAVLKLVSRSNGNMEILLDNDPLLSSLSRVLREDYEHGSRPEHYVRLLSVLAVSRCTR